jgi:serine/threonine protein kinase
MASGGAGGGGFRPYPIKPSEKNSETWGLPSVSRTISFPTEFPLFYKALLENATRTIDILGDPIAIGASAKVYLVRVNGLFYIIKRVLPSFMGKFYSEVSMFEQIKYKPAAEHVVTFLASTETSKGGFILFPYEQGMTLHKWLAQGHNTKEKSEMESKVNTAIKALHDAGVIHSDVKSNNIYVLKNNKPLLLDLGESIIIDTIDFLDYREDVNRNFRMLAEAFKPPLVQKYEFYSKDPIADRINQLLSAAPAPAASSGMAGGYRKKHRSRSKNHRKTKRATTRRARSHRQK